MSSVYIYYRIAIHDAQHQAEATLRRPPHHVATARATTTDATRRGRAGPVLGRAPLPSATHLPAHPALSLPGRVRFGCLVLSPPPLRSRHACPTVYGDAPHASRRAWRYVSRRRPRAADLLYIPVNSPPPPPPQFGLPRVTLAGFWPFCCVLWGVAVDAGLKEYLRRVIHYDQMDLEYTFWQMFYLCVAPARVCADSHSGTSQLAAA
jgi:hypothetical protein